MIMGMYGDLDITPDAYCEIIFDLTSGDIIRGRGNGKLNLQIDTKGDFNMFGDYEIDEGLGQSTDFSGYRDKEDLHCGPEKRFAQGKIGAANNGGRG